MEVSPASQPEKERNAPSLTDLSTPKDPSTAELRLRSRLHSALKHFSQAETDGQEAIAMRRLRLALKAYEKQAQHSALPAISHKLLGYGYIWYGCYLLERRRHMETAKEALIEGLAHCNRGNADLAIRIAGTSSLANYYLARGETQQARALCEKSLERWDRIEVRHAAVGKLLQIYGEVLSQLGNDALSWRQFEAAKNYFDAYRRHVTGRYSELMYVDALKRWCKQILLLPGKSLEECSGLIREIANHSENLLGSDYHTTISSKIELIHARILTGDLQSAERECFEVAAKLHAVQEQQERQGKRKRRQKKAGGNSYQALTPAEAQTTATQCELLTLQAVTQYFKGNELTAMEYIRDACKLTFNLQDYSATNIKCVFLSLGTCWEHRRKRPQAMRLMEMLKKTAEVAAETLSAGRYEK